MVTVKKEGVILRKTTLTFEDEGVLNPAIYQDGSFGITIFSTLMSIMTLPTDMFVVLVSSLDNPNGRDLSHPQSHHYWNGKQ